MQELSWLVDSGRLINFEDGIDNVYRERLFELIEVHGVEAVIGLTYALRKESPTMVAFTLRYMAEFQDRKTESLRFQIISLHLKHPITEVRDGAILALADFHSEKAIRPLEDALRVEKSRFLKQSIAALLARLKGR